MKLASGTIDREGVILDDAMHVATAMTRHGASVWKVMCGERHGGRTRSLEVFGCVIGLIALDS